MNRITLTAVAAVFAISACDRADDIISAEMNMNDPKIEQMADAIETDGQRALFEAYVARRASGDADAEMITVADAIAQQRAFEAEQAAVAAEAEAADEAQADAAAAASDEGEEAEATTDAANLASYVTIELDGENRDARRDEIGMDFKITNRADLTIERVAGIATFTGEDGRTLSYPLVIEDSVRGGRTVNWSGTKSYEGRSANDKALLETVRSNEQFRFQPTGILFADGSSIGKIDAGE
ncbi:MAG: hypothetical protein WA979_03390 [Pacificimonas sp.]